MSHSREEVISLLQESEVAAIATVAGDKMRSRMMHFAVDDDFTVYLATMKGDPKTLQMTHHPGISLLIHRPQADINQSREVEITGVAVFVRDAQERQKALELTAKKSPVVQYLTQTGNAHILDCIKVIPQLIKYRIFAEIVQGKPPTVIEFPGTEQVVNEWGMLGRKLRDWYRALRPAFLTASLIPLLLGGAIAWASLGSLHWGLFLLTLVAGLMLQAGVNTINDYFDHKSGNDEVNREFVRPFSGGSRFIQLGLLTPSEVLGIALFAFLTASLIGLYLAWVRGPLILALGLIGVASGFFYTGKPFYWAKRGLGELLVGLNFGPLMVLGTYYVQTQSFSWTPVIAAIPVGLLIANVLYINEFPDYAADRRVGKATWVVRLGRARAVPIYALLTLAAYAALAASSAWGVVPWGALLALITLPFSLRAIQQARRFHSSSFDLAPANALTIVAHLGVGLALTWGFLWVGVNKSPLTYLALGLLGLAFLSYIIYMYRSVERQKRIFHGVKGVVGS